MTPAKSHHAALRFLGVQRACRRGGQWHLKRHENRAGIAGQKTASAGLFSSTDRTYKKSPSLDFGTQCPEARPHSGKVAGQQATVKV